MEKCLKFKVQWIFSQTLEATSISNSIRFFKKLEWTKLLFFLYHVVWFEFFIPKKKRLRNCFHQRKINFPYYRVSFIKEVFILKTNVFKRIQTWSFQSFYIVWYIFSLCQKYLFVNLWKFMTSFFFITKFSHLKKFFVAIILVAELLLPSKFFFFACKIFYVLQRLYNVVLAQTWYIKASRVTVCRIGTFQLWANIDSKSI